MKNLAKYMTMLMMVLAMGLTFSSCGDDDDDDKGVTITIQNNSTYDLPRFRVVFLNNRDEQLTDRDFGTLSPGDKIKADVPTGAVEFYMATYLNGNWYFSPNYSTSYRNLKLSNAEVGEWSTN